MLNSKQLNQYTTIRNKLDYITKDLYIQDNDSFSIIGNSSFLYNHNDLGYGEFDIDVIENILLDIQLTTTLYRKDNLIKPTDNIIYSIFELMNNRELTGFKYLTELNGIKYDDFDASIKRKIRRYCLRAVIHNEKF